MPNDHPLAEDSINILVVGNELRLKPCVYYDNNRQKCNTFQLEKVLCVGAGKGQKEWRIN
jgi:hypothetical protein